jgi:hypothetical protein
MLQTVFLAGWSLGSGRRRPSGETFLNQIALDLPVFERRQKEPIRLITIKSLTWSSRLLSRILRGFLQFASRFCSSPSSLSRPCSSPDHCSVFVLCQCIRIAIRERSWANPLRPPLSLTPGTSKGFAD